MSTTATLDSDQDPFSSISQLLCELCRGFYVLGWVSGTGGSISIKDQGHIYMSPSGVQKERMTPNDIFVLDEQGKIIKHGTNPHRVLRRSQCFPLFMSAYNLRGAGAVIHTHSLDACLVTLLFQDEFRCSHLEMIKGIDGLGFEDTLVVPIIENTPHEKDLEQSMRRAMLAYPHASAVLVRRHGVYVWGKDWVSAKSQAECYDYLFRAVVEMKRLGISPEKGIEGKQQQCILLDVEGTTSSISFVAETLFPYVRTNVSEFVRREGYDEDVKRCCDAIIDEVMPPERSYAKDVFIPQVYACVNELMDKDAKFGPLKELQGIIWTYGYERKQLVGHMFEDVRPCLESWKRRGMSVYIYSSGSVQAQKLIFQYSERGDLSEFIDGYFDTEVGHKKQAESYLEISKRIGVDPQRIMFLTDRPEESTAAVSAGLETRLVVRPGNAELDPDCPFQTINSFVDLKL